MMQWVTYTGCANINYALLIGQDKSDTGPILKIYENLLDGILNKKNDGILHNKRLLMFTLLFKFITISLLVKK